MRPFTRTAAPGLLASFSKIWGEEYAVKKLEKPNYRFQWKSYKGLRVNLHILPALKQMTDEHCAYCDSYPPGHYSDNTVDHFLPKGDPRFYHLVYEWSNLYFSCASCQAYKKEQHEPTLLRPDEPSFSFSIYFSYDFVEHIIKPNPLATIAQQARAAGSIKLFGLNDAKHVRTRKAFYAEYVIETEKCNSLDLRDFPYRFMFEP